VRVATGTLPVSGQAFKLQFASATSGPWIDVGATSSATVWRGYDNAGVTEESTLPSTLLASSTAPETYEEMNPSKLNPTAISAGGHGEWDWVLQNNGAIDGHTYYFRMVKQDGSAFDFYTRYPALSTPAASQQEGSLVSSIFDTLSVGGAAYNYVLWQGSLPADTGVDFQFASANSPSGPWTYLGYDCTTNTRYSNVLPNVARRINAACHTNYRYFRYKVYLRSNPPGYELTPTVEDIVIGWSP